jgi:hypothetical protein
MATSRRSRRASRSASGSAKPGERQRVRPCTTARSIRNAKQPGPAKWACRNATPGGEQGAGALGEPVAGHDLGVEHHRVLVIRAHGELAAVDLLGQDLGLGPVRLAAVGVDVDGAFAGVRAAEGERVVGEQEQAVAGLGVAQGAPARLGALGDDVAAHRGTRVGVACGQGVDDELGHAPCNGARRRNVISSPWCAPGGGGAPCTAAPRRGSRARSPPPWPWSLRGR